VCENGTKCTTCTTGFTLNLAKTTCTATGTP
jgi:hypothetical protein